MKIFNLMISFLFCLIISFTSCAPSLFTTKQGFRVVTKDDFVKREVLETAIDITNKYLCNRFPDVYYPDRFLKIKRVSDFYLFQIRILPDYLNTGIFECNIGDVVWCRGLYRSSYSTKIITYVNNKCIANTSLVHELLHFYSDIIEMKMDKGHERVEYFRLGCYSLYSGQTLKECLDKSAETQINLILCDELCGGECELRGFKP